jgi:hypothetical protein
MTNIIQIARYYICTTGLPGKHESDRDKVSALGLRLRLLEKESNSTSPRMLYGHPATPRMLHLQLEGNNNSFILSVLWSCFINS